MKEFRKAIYRTSIEDSVDPFPPHTIDSFESNCGEDYRILVSSLTLENPVLIDTIFTIKTDITTTGNCSDTSSFIKNVTILAGETYGISEGCAVPGQIPYPTGGVICDSYLI